MTYKIHFTWRSVVPKDSTSLPFMYKVQVVISATGSRAELGSKDIYKDIINTRRDSRLGVVKDGRTAGEK